MTRDARPLEKTKRPQWHEIAAELPSTGPDCGGGSPRVAHTVFLRQADDNLLKLRVLPILMPSCGMGFIGASPTPAIVSKSKKNGATATGRLPILCIDYARGWRDGTERFRPSRYRLPRVEELIMQVKVYVPKMVEVPSEYLPALAKRAADCMGDRAHEISATRGHLVRQAVQDGLLREFDDLISEDGTVDLVCDPGMEIPLELENKTLTLAELLDVLQYKRSWSDMKASSDAA
jgi:hypothetical protein